MSFQKQTVGMADMEVQERNHRIAVLNDFNAVTAVIDCKRYGDLFVTDAWKNQINHKGYQLEKDSIGIFVDFEMIGEFKIKEDASEFLKGIISEAPKHFLSDVQQFGYLLFEAVDDKKNQKSDGRD